MSANRIHPSAVLAAALVLSLLLWYPTLEACIAGDVALSTAALRYLLVFAFVRVAASVIVYLVHHYRSEADEAFVYAQLAELERQSRAVNEQPSL